MVRLRGKPLHVIALIVRTWNGAELAFPIALDPRALRGISRQWLVVIQGCRTGQAAQKSEDQNKIASHSLPPENCEL